MLRLKPRHGRHARPNWDLRVGWFAVIVSLFAWFIALVLIVIVVNAITGVQLRPTPTPP